MIATDSENLDKLLLLWDYLELRSSLREKLEALLTFSLEILPSKFFFLQEIFSRMCLSADGIIHKWLTSLFIRLSWLTNVIKRKVIYLSNYLDYPKKSEISEQNVMRCKKNCEIGGLGYM